MYFYNGDLSTMKLLGYITVIQLWWIAVWGIAYIAIEYLSQKSKKRELLIYFLFISVVFCVVLLKPDLIRHF
jgi:predicted membrane channel-forming protein YqfA (hemolysin III family)